MHLNASFLVLSSTSFILDNHLNASETIYLYSINVLDAKVHQNYSSSYGGSGFDI